MKSTVNGVFLILHRQKRLSSNKFFVGRLTTGLLQVGSTDLLQVDGQNLLSTGVLQVVLTS